MIHGYEIYSTVLKYLRTTFFDRGICSHCYKERYFVLQFESLDVPTGQFRPLELENANEIVD